MKKTAANAIFFRPDRAQIDMDKSQLAVPVTEQQQQM